MQKYYFQNSEVLGNELSWNPDWLHDTESVYSIACKLATANHLSIPDAFQYLAPSRDDVVYRTWTGLDAGRLAKCLQVPYQQIRGSLPTWFYRTGATLDDFYHRALRFCPQCLESGFHSIAHQCRLLDRCPAHGCPLLTGCPSCYEPINPFVGHPWQCPSCQHNLAVFREFQWLKRFRIAPVCEPGLSWDRVRAHQQLFRKHSSHQTAGYAAFLARRTGRVRISAKDTELFVDDITYWRRNARKLGIWYFQEQQALMRSVFHSHLDCTLRDRVENVFYGASGRCIAATGQQIVAELVWQTDAALLWPSFSWNALKNIELHLLKHLFHSPSGRFLADRPAEMVVRGLVHCFVVSAIVACGLGRDVDRYIDPNLSGKLCESKGVAWTADATEFLLESPLSHYVLPHLAEFADQNCDFIHLSK